MWGQIRSYRVKVGPKLFGRCIWSDWTYYMKPKTTNSKLSFHSNEPSCNKPETEFSPRTQAKSTYVILTSILSNLIYFDSILQLSKSIKTMKAIKTMKKLSNYENLSKILTAVKNRRTQFIFTKSEKHITYKALSVTTNVVGLQTDDVDHVDQNSSAHVARVSVCILMLLS